MIHQATNRRATYGSLVDKAAALPVPKNVTLKDPKAFTLLGKDVPRLDIPNKVNGTAGVRRGREAAGSAGCPRRPLPGLRRQGGELQRRQGQGRTRREARRADCQRDRGRRRRLLGGVERRQGAASHLGRRAARHAVVGRHHEEVRRAGAEAGRRRAQGRRLRRRVRQGRQDHRAGIRGAVPGARVHGADELHRQRHGGALRRLSADTVTDGDAAGGDGDLGPAAGQGVRAPHLHGRRLRPARRGRLRRRRGGDLEEGRRPGQGDVEPRGRHPARLLPTGDLRADVGGTRRQRQPDGVAAAHRAVVADEEAQPGFAEADGRRRSDFGRRRGHAALRHPEPARRVHRDRSGRAVRLLAIGRELRERLRHRGVHRRDGHGGRQGSRTSSGARSWPSTRGTARCWT